MKKLVISLLTRPDRKVSFNNNQLQNFKYLQAYAPKDIPHKEIATQSNWIDPFRKRKILDSEVACFLSHRKAWLKCIELNQPVIIMEDDAVINDTWNENYYEELIKDYDFVYLQRNENEPNKVTNINDKIEIPYYPYNLTAYVIKPNTAKILANKDMLKKIIPVDEYLPQLIQDQTIKAVALKQDSCNQISRNISKSDITEGKIYRDYNVHPITIGTDRKKCIKLNTSATLNGISVKNLGTNVEWEGTDMTAYGGGHKVNLLRKYIDFLPDNDIILFTDAYDVFYADDLDTIVERYLDFDCKLLFSAEAVCWPNKDIASDFPESYTKYRYLNSGTFIGRVDELKLIIDSGTVDNDGDDQLFYQKAFLSNKFNIKLDYEAYIFNTHEVDVVKNGSQLYNRHTETFGCIYHGNGGDDAKVKFDELYNTFYPQQKGLFIPHNNKIDFLTDDMLVVDFMTQDQCERMIEIADKHGGWGSLTYDKFPAQEIRLTELGLFDELEKHWTENIVPTIEQYWKPLLSYGLRDAFVMRYALDTQVNLNLHHDASLVTGSVKLNDDYEGASLIFPRQGINNDDVPVGKCILFPATVTHGHECLQLKKGVKYSFTIWSKRFPQDQI